MRAIWTLLAIVLLAAAGALCYLLLQDQPGPSLPAVQVPAPPVDVDSLPTIDVPEGPPPAADAIVFDMAYRGLGPEDELRYNAYWGFGGSSDADTPFLQAVRQTAGKVEPIQNPNFKGAEWAAVELRRNKPVALYLDLNADGKLDDFERILPIDEAGRYGHIEFITPDFLTTTEKGVQMPFRALVQAREGGYAMWSPSCVLEGAAKMDGRDMNLLLYANGFTGSFVQFGRCSYTLKDADAPKERYVARHPLSSLINHDGTFYKVRFIRQPENNGRLQAVIEKDTTPTGQLAVKLLGNEDMQARLSSANISGAEDNTIRFSVSGGQSTALPQGDYVLASGYMYYGLADTNERHVDFTNGPPLKIVAGETLTVELGKAQMTVSAIDQQDRYRSDVQEKSVFTKGTKVFLSPRIAGLAGEKYGRFREREDIEPTFEITGSDGKRIASGKMEYG